MNDLLIIGFRTVFLYILILIILRIMGKREVGELGIIDVVVFVIMAEVAAFALDSPDKKLIQLHYTNAYFARYPTRFFLFFIEK